MDTRALFVAERHSLLGLLDRIGAEQWLTATAAPGWTVKDVSLHLLDGYLGRLSRDRDGDVTGLVPVGEGWPRFVAGLAAKNERWLDGARQLSSRVTRDLLGFAGDQLDLWMSEVNLLEPSSVSWASDGPVPAWLDLAREMTETWVHHQQIRSAIGQPLGIERLPNVLRTFVWALPHQYRVVAPPGTTVVVDLDIGGTWHLVAGIANQWNLHEGDVAGSAASVAFSADAAWRSFTSASVSPEGIRSVGPAELTEPVTKVRGIIV